MMTRSPRPLTTTEAPSAASASAIALPIFLPAPVTIATLPDSARVSVIAASADCAKANHRAPRAVNPALERQAVGGGRDRVFGCAGQRAAGTVTGEPRHD